MSTWRIEEHKDRVRSELDAYYHRRLRRDIDEADDRDLSEIMTESEYKYVLYYRNGLMDRLGDEAEDFFLAQVPDREAARVMAAEFRRRLVAPEVPRVVMPEDAAGRVNPEPAATERASSGGAYGQPIAADPEMRTVDKVVVAGAAAVTLISVVVGSFWSALLSALAGLGYYVSRSGKRTTSTKSETGLRPSQAPPVPERARPPVRRSTLMGRQEIRHLVTQLLKEREREVAGLLMKMLDQADALVKELLAGGGRLA